jgi:hypothetical protein
MGMSPSQPISTLNGVETTLEVWVGEEEEEEFDP